MSTRKIMQDQMSLKSLYQSPLPPPNVNVEGLAVMYCGVVSTNIEIWGPGRVQQNLELSIPGGCMATIDGHQGRRPPALPVSASCMSTS